MTLRAKMSLLVSAVALSAMGTVASTDSIQIFGSPVLSPSGVNTNFAYTVQVTSGNQINTGDFFTLVDFGGFVSVGVIPSGWALTNSANLAVTPNGAATLISGSTYLIHTQAAGVAVVDSSTIPDLTFQYTGPTLTAGVSNLTVGTFNIVSTFNAATNNSTIVGSDHQTSTGNPGQNGDPYITPGTAPSGVPLPAAAWGGMSLMGALGAGKIIRRRRAR